MAVDATINQFTIVVNGQTLDRRAFPIPEGEQAPINLTEKLLVFKIYNGGIWYQSKNKVANLNIFSKQMTLPEMISRTSGNNCGKADGDYLDWESADWVLKGEASLGEVSVEDLCRRESKIQVFTAPTGGLEHCKDICGKIQNGVMATMRSSRESQDLFNRVDEVLVAKGAPTRAARIAVAAWVPIHRAGEGSWIDEYNKDPVEDITWAKGHPASDLCAIYVLPWKGLGSYHCTVDIKKSFIYCPCSFPVQKPHLTLRGLCPDSHIDQSYLARNDPLTGFLYFYGHYKTIARFDGKKWSMFSAFFNTSASTDAKPDTFILGKHRWKVNGDSEDCHSGKPYETELKLTGCNEDEYTCSDGQCTTMEERCNQVIDCRDKSDEKGCQLILFEGDYNKNIPPIGKTAKGVAIPANVSISITLMKVVEIEEIDHSIHLQFEINMQWRENRVKYQNLKIKTSLNALTKNDIEMLWLPLIVFANTDQKETTRLGWITEWQTDVSVIKEGNFTRSGIEEVDEAEIFEGNGNTLIMTQTYTHEFQCKYKLQQYPFDNQVIRKPSNPSYLLKEKKNWWIHPLFSPKNWRKSA